MELTDRRKFYFAIATLSVVTALAILDKVSGQEVMVCITSLTALFNAANAVEWWSKNRPQ